jgi:O-antigen/teichoic acid export membrane protein
VVAANVVFGCVTAVLLASVGFLVGGRVGRGLALFAPWVIPALLQDLWRMLLFRDGRGFAAASNDGAWLIGMLLTLPFAWSIGADWGIAAWWGLGATCGAVAGFIQVRPRRGDLGDAWIWATRNAWPLGRWFAAEGVVYTAASQSVIFVVAALLGTRAVGGLRSVQILFAPLALLGPAFALPGLPSIVEALRRSPEAAWRMALKLNAVLSVLAVGYLVASLVAGEWLLSALLGARFSRYSELIWPLGVQQVLVASTSALFPLLKAARRGKAVLLYRSIVSLATVVAVVGLTEAFRLVGAAWGAAVGAAIGSVVLVFLCRPKRRVSVSPE